MVWSLFIIDLMGLFSTTNRLHHSYSGFTHYRNYRAETFSSFLSEKSRFLKMCIRDRKTTIVNLLMKFYEIDQGSIRIDGVHTKDMKRSEVHDAFSMVCLLYTSRCV